jgi:predicted amino acid racemase
MFLDATLARNAGLVDAAIELHRSGRIRPNTFVVDIDRVADNAAAIAAAGRSTGLTLQAMTKQQGRDPFVALAARLGGIGGAVAVDVPEARVLHLHGIPIWHVGHLVQVAAADTDDVLAMEPRAVTVFSEEAARRTGEGAIRLGRVQDVLLRVWRPGDYLHPGQEGGFRLDELGPAAERIVRLPGVRVAGVTSFPCFLWQADEALVRPTGNLESVREAARLLRDDLGLELSQVNMPGVNCAATLPLVAAAGGTHAEPGSALAGQTPLHAVSPAEPEIPAMVYVSEVASVEADRAYCFGGGFYARSRIRRALVAGSHGRALVTAPQLPPEAIDYYGPLDTSAIDRPAVGDSVVFAFRSQIFVGRCQVAAVAGIGRGSPEVLGICDQHGNLLGEDQLPVGSGDAARLVGEVWASYLASREEVGV